MKDYRVVRLEVAHRVYGVQVLADAGPQAGEWLHCPEKFDTYEDAVTDMAERQARKDNRWIVVEDEIGHP